MSGEGVLPNADHAQAAMMAAADRSAGVPMADLPAMQAWAEQLMRSRSYDFAIGGEEDPYMLRWWVVPRNPWCNLYLHSILRSDDDRALHDHPWPNTSLLIFGSYIEHTPDGSFLRQAGDTVFRPASAQHRLEVIPGERAISLFSTGPKEREWGFACPQGWVHWKDFSDPVETGRAGRGCGEHEFPTPVTPIGMPRENADA